MGNTSARLTPEYADTLERLRQLYFKQEVEQAVLKQLLLSIEYSNRQDKIALNWQFRRQGQEQKDLEVLLYKHHTKNLHLCQAIRVAVLPVPGVGLEPTQPLGPTDFESVASTNSATRAIKRSTYTRPERILHKRHNEHGIARSPQYPARTDPGQNVRLGNGSRQNPVRNP